MELRQYQREDAEFLKKYKTVGCFNEQRTGKTPTTIVAVTEAGYTKPLIVCPASAQYQWAEEYVRWSGLPATVCVGTREKKLKRISEWETGALIISYDSLKGTSVRDSLVNEVLARNPNAVLADEAHRFKNPKSQTFKAIKQLTAITKRIAMTGTPAPGKPEEIFTILQWLFPEHFTSQYKFHDAYFNTRLQSMGGRRFVEVAGFKPGMERKLQYFLSTISTQRKRREVMQWLPEKDIREVKLPLTKQQEKYLADLEKFFETEHIITQGILDRLIRYRQICLAPQLLELKGGSPKLDWLVDYFKDYPDTPTIVFSKFTSFIHVIRQELTRNKGLKVGVIVGDTPAKERAANVKAFQAGELNVLLINIDAGKEALTLDRGEAIIFTDVYPPSSDIQQAEDRFVATTQDKANKPHTIYRLMMKHSYDEEVYKLVDSNAATTDLLNDFKKYLKGKM